jgi:hypothetical protein
MTQPEQTDAVRPMTNGDMLCLVSRDLDQRLRRIEGQLAIVCRALEVDRDERDIDREIAKAYRRGYLTGRNAARRGGPADPDGALANRRRRTGRRL